MARQRDLSSLLGDATLTAADPRPSSQIEAPEPPPSASPAAPRTPAAKAAPKNRTDKPAAPDVTPSYLTFERKETRIRPDQYQELTEISRRLNRARAGAGERLTENTLIRVAIDYLLLRAADLSGTTETELRKSVGL